MDLSKRLRIGWRNAIIDAWRSVIVDLQPGRRASRGWIERTFDENRLASGAAYWSSLLPYVREDKYHRWCGLGPAWIGRYMLGDFVEDEQCVDVALNPRVAYFCLPGTGRILSEDKWAQAGCPMPDRISPAHLEPGDIVLLDTTHTGSPNHIALCDKPPNDFGRFDTVECNATAELGDHTYGEGIVRFRHLSKPIQGVNGDLHRVQPRHVDEVVCGLRLDHEKGHFVGSYLEAA